MAWSLSKSARFFSLSLLFLGFSAEAPSAQTVGGVETAALNCAMRNALAVNLAAQPNLDWGAISAACDDYVASAKAADPVGHSWFVNASNGFVGVPLVLLKVFPDLAPEIWGAPEDFYSNFGFFRDPDHPDRILPRGLGVAGSARPVDSAGSPTGEIDYSTPQPLFVTLACGACHSGQIDMGDGTLVLDGAPNTQFDVRRWRGAFTTLRAGYLATDQIGTADAPGETTIKLLELVASKPPGFFARGLPLITEAEIAAVDATQRAIFNANSVAFLTGLSQSTGVRAAAVALQTRAGSSYGHGDRSPGLAGHSSGQSDGSGDLLADLLAVEAATKGEMQELLTGPLPVQLPRFATVTDAPSVWNQADRSVGQWDGSVLEPFWRNIAAALPIVGVPGKVDLINAAIVAEFLQGLPSAPYPFPVDLAKAAEGEAIFAENCGTCHRPRNASRYPEVGTDMNRAQVLNTEGTALFVAAFQSACHDATFGYRDRAGRYLQPCSMPAHRILRDTSEVDNQGYLAPPLDGIWARAPYLHNGSVPTLTHLLKPADRPDTFLRGAISYDTDFVGWVWDTSQQADMSALYPTVSVHDTSKDGLSNRGHARDLVIEGKSLRLDWSDPAQATALSALLEYLKTQ